MSKNVIINCRLFPECDREDCFANDPRRKACMILDERCDRPILGCPFYIEREERKRRLEASKKRWKEHGGG